MVGFSFAEKKGKERKKEKEKSKPLVMDGIKISGGLPDFAPKQQTNKQTNKRTT
jgi:hypothetical protein